MKPKLTALHLYPQATREMNAFLHTRLNLHWPKELTDTRSQHSRLPASLFFPPIYARRLQHQDEGRS